MNENNNIPEWHAPEIDQLSPFMLNRADIYQQMTEFTLQGLSNADFSNDGDSTVYELNSDGFRGPEFGKVDILTAGCSQTFGVGISDEADTWPALLANLSKMSYVNLGRPRASNQSIVQLIFSYIKRHGKPKIICVNFPSLYRFTLPIRDDITTYSTKDSRKDMSKLSAKYGSPYVEVLDMSMTPTGTTADDVVNWPQYGKRPYDITKVIPYEAAIYLSMMSINYLIEYCNASNIKLFFSTWYQDTDKFFSIKLERKTDPRFSTLCDLDMSGYTKIIGDLETFKRDPQWIVECHDNDMNKPDWDVGLDRAGHMGVHMHLHFAEAFYKRILS